MTKQTQKGFTLVELAIVMTIIGLLIGGILKGQELMQNARVTSTIAQVRSYEAATTTFRDKYDAVPGDMTNAGTRLPNCGIACNANVTTGATGIGGDGLVGLNNWSSTWATQGSTTNIASVTTAGAGGVRFETHLFWTQLLLADLIAGVTNAAVTGGTTTWGETHPAAKIGGGFVVGYAAGNTTPGRTAATTGGPTGMVLALMPSPVIGTAATMVTAGQQPLTATRAAQIDRKMDDGRSSTGYVQAYGVATSCFTTAGGAVYVESTTGNDCGLVFRIQG